METERLILRERTSQLMVSVKTMTLGERQAFFGTEVEKVLNKELAIIEQGIESYNVKYKYWDLIEKETGIVIGNAGFHVWHFRHNRAELGYCLHKETYKQKGFMTEALGCMIPYAFGPEMDLNRITAHTAPDNVASIRLLKKFGFVHEGQMRQDYWHHDRYYDSEIYGLLKSEYKN